MYRTFIQICLIFFSLQSYGQGIIISDPVELELDYYYNLLGKQNDKYYFLKGGDLDYEIFGFDKDLKKLWSTEFKMDKKRPKLSMCLARKEIARNGPPKVTRWIFPTSLHPGSTLGGPDFDFDFGIVDRFLKEIFTPRILLALS